MGLNVVELHREIAYLFRHIFHRRNQSASSHIDRRINEIR
jgi:hypothetical protein